MEEEEEELLQREQEEQEHSEEATRTDGEEHAFAKAFHETIGRLHAVEVAFVPSNPWGAQAEDEAEFETILRKPIEDADITEEQKQELEGLLRRYYDVFRLGACLSPVKGFEYDLELIDPKTRPVFVRPRRVDPGLLEKAQQHFDTLVEKGVCEAADSPWSFPLVIAPKRSAETGSSQTSDIASTSNR